MIFRPKSAVIRAEYVLWALLAFLMPLWQQVLPLLLGGLLLLRVLFRTHRTGSPSRMDRSFLVLFIVLYALHALGMLWTENVAHGLFDLQVKLALILVPLLLYTSPIDREDLVVVGFGGIIVGSVVAAFVGFAHMAWLCFFGDDDVLFAGTGFSFYMHQGYFASFFCFSFIGLSELLVRRNKLFSGIAKKIAILCLFVLAAAIVFTLSRTGLIVLGLSALVVAFSGLMKWRTKRSMILLITTSLIGVVLVGTTANRMIGRFEGLFRTLNKIETLDVTATDANTVRILLLDISADLIDQNFWTGVGTGDIKDELRSNAISKGYSGVSRMDLNAHDQFLQVFSTPQ